MEKELFILLLNHEFYKKNKHKIVETFFPDELKELLKTLYLAHEKFEKNISLSELKALHFVKHAALSLSAKENYDRIITGLSSTQPASNDVAVHILESLSTQEKARKIADKAIDVINGKTDSFVELLRTVASCEQEKSEDEAEFKAVTTDVDELLAVCPVNGKWQFHLEELQKAVQGVNPGHFVIVPARPETGKTAFWVSLAASPGGFLAQGASVHAIVNEEPGERTMLRAINSGTGVPTSELFVRQEEARSWVDNKFQRFRIVDSVGLTIEGLDRYAARHRPDILIVDQLDKLGIDGSFARTDEKLRAIYTAAREIAKRYGLVFFAISQASAGAEGRLFITMDLLENSRTGKAAEADLILAIGKRNTETGVDEPARSIYIPKNKISGWHGTVTCMLNHQISRYY